MLAKVRLRAQSAALGPAHAVGSHSGGGGGAWEEEAPSPPHPHPALLGGGAVLRALAAASGQRPCAPRAQRAAEL